MVDAGEAMKLTAEWELLGEEEVLGPFYPEGDLPFRIREMEKVSLVFRVEEGGIVETAEVRFLSDHRARGDILLTIRSPQGTLSQLTTPYQSYEERPSYPLTLTSVHFMGEWSEGTWEVEVEDVFPYRVGNATEASLTLYVHKGEGGEGNKTKNEKRCKEVKSTYKSLLCCNA